jgi:hypothetical protein
MATKARGKSAATKMALANKEIRDAAAKEAAAPAAQAAGRLRLFKTAAKSPPAAKAAPEPDMASEPDMAADKAAPFTPPSRDAGKPGPAKARQMALAAGQPTPAQQRFNAMRAAAAVALEPVGPVIPFPALGPVKAKKGAGKPAMAVKEEEADDAEVPLPSKEPIPCDGNKRMLSKLSYLAKKGSNVQESYKAMTIEGLGCAIVCCFLFLLTNPLLFVDDNVVYVDDVYVCD